MLHPFLSYATEPLSYQINITSTINIFMALFLSIFIVPSSDMDVQIKAEPGILVPDENYLVAKCNFDNIR